jgi:hypothetical protein
MSSASTHRGQNRNLGTDRHWRLVIGIPATDRDGTAVEQARDSRPGIRDGPPQVADATAVPGDLERAGAGQLGESREKCEPERTG